MRNPSRFNVYVVGASTLAMLLTTSAFAESRHHDRTGRADQPAGSHESRGGRNDSNHGDSSRGVDRNTNRGFDQNRGVDRNTNRGFDQNRGVDRNTNRGFDQNRGFDRNNNRGFDQNRGVDRNTNRGFDQNRGFDRNTNRGFDANRGFDRNNNRGFDANRGFDRNNNRSSDFRGSREQFRNGIPRSDGRVSMLGRVNRFERERGGYRIWFGGSAFPYWVPESYFLGRRIGIGLDLRLGGIFRNGAVYVDALGWPGDPYYTDPYYNDGYSGAGYGVVGAYNGAYNDGAYDNGLRGIVDSVDYRAGLLYVRDDSSRRVITVDMRRVDRRSSRVDFGDLHPGDRISLTGAWVSDGQFAAARIDGVDGY